MNGALTPERPGQWPGTTVCTIAAQHQVLAFARVTSIPETPPLGTQAAHTPREEAGVSVRHTRTHKLGV